MILGGGPNRIGQGIEFDYCCVHAAFALKEDGFETIMVNSNPGNRLDGLRHERQIIFRAAHAGRRAAHLRARKMLGRHRAIRRADAAEPRAGVCKKTASTSSALRRRASRSPRTANCSRRCSTSWTFRSRRTASRRTKPKRWASPNGWVIPCWCGPRSCSAGARCRSFIRMPNLRITCASRSKLRRNARCWWTNFSKTPPRWTWIASRTSAISRSE